MYVQANITRTNHIMWTMGDDFQYQYAESWFRQMDRFIHYIKKVWSNGKSILSNVYCILITGLLFPIMICVFWERIIYQDGRINALYSTPSIYTDAKHAANESWPLKTDDFFPWVLHPTSSLKFMMFLLVKNNFFWYSIINRYAFTLIITDMLIVIMHTGLASLPVAQPLKDISGRLVDITWYVITHKS